MEEPLGLQSSNTHGVAPLSALSRGGHAEHGVALALIAAVLICSALARLGSGRPLDVTALARLFMPLAAAGFAAAAVLVVDRPWRSRRAQNVLLWSGVLLMGWIANGLPFDLLRLAGLIPLPVDGPALATKAFALVTAIVLTHLAMTRPAEVRRARPATWYGYAAFVLALPYPVLRTCWALGGTPGLHWAGAAGEGWAPWLLAIPWLAAAGLSLLLVPTWRWLPRWLLLTAGWSATAIVGLIGPVASWVFFSTLAAGGPMKTRGIALWVFGLFYGSWLLWAIAAGAATRSYQVRTASVSVVT
jgi:hypothetical protein